MCLVLIFFFSFDALVLRFEAPDSRNRWDSPLFTILKDDALPYEDISDALFKRKAPPPNQSTQSVSNNRIQYSIDVVLLCCLFHYLIVIFFFSAATTVICELLARVGQDHTRCVIGMFLRICGYFLTVTRWDIHFAGAGLSFDHNGENSKSPKN